MFWTPCSAPSPGRLSRSDGGTAAGRLLCSALACTRVHKGVVGGAGCGIGTRQGWCEAGPAGAARITPRRLGGIHQPGLTRKLAGPGQQLERQAAGRRCTGPAGCAGAPAPRQTRGNPSTRLPQELQQWAWAGRPSPAGCPASALRVDRGLGRPVEASRRRPPGARAGGHPGPGAGTSGL